MPAARDMKPSDLPLGKAPSGWTKEQKSMLFNHVIKHGEKNWGVAVPGKSSQQSHDQWRKTLLPQIRKMINL